MEKFFGLHCPNIKPSSSLERDKKTKVWPRTSAIVPCIALKSLAQRISKISSLRQPHCIFPTFLLLLQWMIWRTCSQKLDVQWRLLSSFRKTVRWLSFSWDLWKKQSRPLLSFTIMILEKITISEFPSPNPPSDLCDTSPHTDHNFYKTFRHRLKQLKTNSASFTKVTLWEFDWYSSTFKTRNISFFSSHFPQQCMIKSLLCLCIVVSMKITFRKKISGKYFLNNLIPWIRFQKNRVSLCLGPNQPYMTFLNSFVLWRI